MTIANLPGQHRHSELLDELITLLQGYGSLHRKSTQPFIHTKLSRLFPDYEFTFDDESIRETLLEHVGSLPIVATFLHPHLEKSVDLGRTLIMLAIHDIGELTVGDELVFLKEDTVKGSEREAAQALLHGSYAELYDELEAGQTYEARFALSVDKITPDIYDLLCGEEYTIRRLSAQASWKSEEVIRNIRARKRPYMEWSSFLTEFHDSLFSRFLSL